MSTSEEVTTTFEQLQARDDLAVATFAGGCFWCIEAPFQETPGVEEVISGFMGGQVENPSYNDVVGGSTGHREAVQVFYDPNQVSYSELLDLFWLQIDPTDPGGQFADRGHQYTTAIYVHDEEQRQLAEESKQTLGESDTHDGEIVTAIESASSFYPAEDYHQDYYQKNEQRYQQYKEGSGRGPFIQQIKEKLGK